MELYTQSQFTEKDVSCPEKLFFTKCQPELSSLSFSHSPASSFSLVPSYSYGACPITAYPIGETF